MELVQLSLLDHERTPREVEFRHRLLTTVMTNHQVMPALKHSQNNQLKVLLRALEMKCKLG